MWGPVCCKLETYNACGGWQSAVRQRSAVFLRPVRGQMSCCSSPAGLHGCHGEATRKNGARRVLLLFLMSSGRQTDWGPRISYIEVGPCKAGKGLMSCKTRWALGSGWLPPIRAQQLLLGAQLCIHGSPPQLAGSSA